MAQAGRNHFIRLDKMATAADLQLIVSAFLNVEGLF
jgi:hypothetical protein